MNIITLKHNPDLPFITKYKGNKVMNGLYKNDEYRFHPSWWAFVKHGFSINPQWRQKRKDSFRVACMPNPDFCTSEKEGIVWLGHSAFFIHLNGIRILIDPCLKNLPFHPRKVGLPCEIKDIKNIDYILLSHGHRDHFDKPSLRQLIRCNPQAEVLTALGLGKLLPNRKITKYQEAGWYQQYRTSPKIEIVFLPAKHWNRRWLHDYNQQLWGSFLIRTPEQTIYFAGDTAYGKHFRKIQSIVGDIDICMMPIGAYKPRHIMKGAHVNPYEAHLAFRELGAKSFIPMHYGTYDLSHEPMGEPIQMIRTFFQFKPEKLIELAVGEDYLFKEEVERQLFIKNG